jgi:hypothetical protein
MDTWAEIFFTYDEIEAEIVKDLLEAEDIQVVVKSMKMTPYPVSIGRMGEMRLIVRNEDLERARELITVMKETSEKETNDY